MSTTARDKAWKPTTEQVRDEISVGSVVCNRGSIIGRVTRYERSGGIRVRSFHDSGGEAIWQPYELTIATTTSIPLF